MKRRDFIKTAGVSGVLGAAGTVVAALGQEKAIAWKMVTTWPKSFSALGSGAEYLAKLINEMSGGRIEVKVFGAGELVPALEIFDAVSRGDAEMGHGASYYWKEKVSAAQFFSTLPFGFTAQEMNGWLYHGGGLELWKEVYEPFGLVPVAAGNSGVQMGGWFNREIKTLEDLKELKMRIPALGGEVLKRAGGIPVNLPGGEVIEALKSGALDAAEWIGPYHDLALGLPKAAKYYYYPGWHEPGAVLECIINRKALDALPKDLQSIVVNACKAANVDILADFTAQNSVALQNLLKSYKVNMRRFPDEVLAKFKELSEQVVAELADKDAVSRKVYESYRKFREQAIAWHQISEQAYLDTRGKP